MESNRRNFFVNSKIRNFFLLYVIFSVLIVILFLGWEIFIELFVSLLPEKPSGIDILRGFPVVIKISLLLLWGFFNFLLSYTFFEARFLGIFSRINHVFREIINNEKQDLQFRGEDDFLFLADSFNGMKSMFLDRINRRKKLLETLTIKFKDLSEDSPKSQIQQIINDIDQELTS